MRDRRGREQQRDEQRCTGAENGDAPIELERETGWEQVLRNDAGCDPHQHRGNGEPRKPADGRKQEILGRELAHEPRAIRAEHRTDRELVAASGVTGQKQIRNVRETNEENESHDGEKKQRSALELGAEHYVAKPLERDAATLVRRGILTCKIRCDSREIVVGHLKGNARFQTRHGLQHVVAACAFRQTLNASRCPHAHRREKLGFVRNHADDREQVPVEPEGLAHDARIGGEARPPIPLGKNSDIRAICFVLGTERAADDRNDTERIEYARRDPLSRHRLRTVRAAHHHAAEAWDEPADRVEGFVALHPIEEIERRHAAFRRRFRSLPDRHQLIRFRQGQIAEQHAIDEREESPVRADPDSQCQYDHERERALLAQHARSEPQVLPKIREQRAARRAHGHGRRHVRLAQRPHALGETRIVAELLADERERGGLVEALIAELGIALLEVRRELFDNLRLAPRLDSQVRKPRLYFFRPIRHG